MDDKTKTTLMVGVPVGLALLAGVIYFATRPAQGGNGVPPPPPPGCQEGTVMTEICPDGSYVVTYQCINGAWIPTGQTCAAPPPPPPPPPTCSPEGSFKSVCCYNYYSGLRTEKCESGQWIPTGIQCSPAGHHSHEICGQHWGGGNYMHLFYKTNYQGNKGVEIKYWSHITNRIESTSYTFIWTYGELVNVLEAWISETRINSLQYQNAIAQAANMGLN